MMMMIPTLHAAGDIMSRSPQTHCHPAPIAADVVRSGGRRWFLQTGLAGFAGLSMPMMLRAKQANGVTKKPTSIIHFWLSGGPSHLDMWDPKPDAPVEVRGPFGSIPTKVPGIRVSEYFPLQAQLMDKLTLIRSVDCSASTHTPITMQAGNALARRTPDGNDGGGHPSMGSLVARYRGPNDPSIPAFIGLADSWVADVWGAGHLGAPYEPVQASRLADQLKLPKGVDATRLEDRESVRQQFDQLRRDLDAGNTMTRMDGYTRQALEMVVSPKAQNAFRIDQEPDRLRDQYGRDSIGEKALLARRLVEAGSTYVLVSGAWGYFDHHGDNVKWGGIVKGLKPLLPRVDRVLHALITDLESRGLLDTTLIVMMGEFGRGPVINKEAGREHWLNCMSMLMAGGGLRHGQVIGSTDAKGYAIKERRVAPADIAATVFQYMGIDLNTQWQSPSGRPMPIVSETGRPMTELF